MVKVCELGVEALPVPHVLGNPGGLRVPVAPEGFRAVIEITVGSSGGHFSYCLIN